jgi:hypothetical protein
MVVAISRTDAGGHPLNTIAPAGQQLECSTSHHHRGRRQRLDVAALSWSPPKAQFLGIASPSAKKKGIASPTIFS